MVRGTFLRALHLFRAKMFKYHSKQQLSLSLATIFLLMSMTACGSNSTTEPLTDLPNDYAGKLISFENTTFGIQSCYPEDWYLHSDENFIFIVPEKNDLPWERGGSSYPYISILILPASTRRPGIGRFTSATDVARRQFRISLNLSNDEPLHVGIVIEPITTVVVGEREAAFYVMEYEKVDLVVYHVLTKMNHNDVAFIEFTTKRSVKQFDMEELTSIVNAIVYCTSPLDDA